MQIYDHLSKAEKEGLVNLNNFKDIKPHKWQSVGKVLPPLISIGKSGIGFLNCDKVTKDYARLFFDDTYKQIMIMFSDKKRTKEFYRVSNQNGSIRIVVPSVIEAVALVTGLKLDQYNYRFKPLVKEEDAGRLIFNYNEPYQKKRRKGYKK